MGEWQSGQMHLTVNQATSVFGGSNPSSPTINYKKAQHLRVKSGKLLIYTQETSGYAGVAQW